MDRPAIPQPDPQVAGTKLGKYEVLARLSAGGMSLIYLAFQRGLGDFRKLVVLKQILPDIQQDPEAVSMFLDEANISAAFSHPNISQVFDLDVQDGALFLAMEFVNGASLLELIRQGSTGRHPPPIGLTLMVIRDTALALHYAHTFRDPTGRVRQVVHRDVAPKNVMVTFEGTTKLMDFGIAKAQGAMKRTRVGIVRGTWGYMAPEQIRGEELDPRCDLFSLGVVFHECLTRQRLFLGRTPEEGFDLTLKERPRPPSELNPEVPLALDAVVLRALEKNRLERFQSGLELARAIERAAAPLIWLPEQAGEFVQSIFGNRRVEAERLLSQASRDITGVFDLSFYRALQGNDSGPKAAPAPRPKPRPSAPRAEPPDETVITPQVAIVLDDEPPTNPSAKPLRERREAAQAASAPARRSAFLPVAVGAWTSLALVGGVLLGRTVLAPKGRPTLASQPAAVASARPAPAPPAPATAPAEPPAPKAPPGEVPAPGGDALALAPPPARPAARPRPRPKEAPAKPASAAPTPAEATEPRAEKPPPAEPAPPAPALPPPEPAPEKAPEPSPPSASRTGSLSLVTEPSAEVFLNTVSLGSTPLSRQPLSAGRHTLKLVGPQGQSTLLRVEIQPDQETSLHVPLESPPPATP